MAVSPTLVEALGWAATAVFVGSYFTRASLLTRVQMVGALMWIAYGVLQHALLEDIVECGRRRDARGEYIR